MARVLTCRIQTPIPVMKGSSLIQGMPLWRRATLWFCVAAGFAGAVDATPPPLGLPLSRFHSLDEIEGINGDFEISFDPLGRLSLVQNGSFAILNDRNWEFLTEFDDTTEVLHAVLQLSEDEAWYGASGSWGKLVRTPSGGFEPVQLSPTDRPTWSKSTNYLMLFPFRDGICFGNWNGLVYRETQSGATAYFEMPEMINAFAIADRLFVISADTGMHEIDLKQNQLHKRDFAPLEQQILYHHTHFNETFMLCATRRDGLFLFDGEQLLPWQNELDSIEDPMITAICQLPENNIAISLDGVGLFILNPQGEVLSAYTAPEFQNIQSIISNEFGILWFSTEFGLQQVFYGSRVAILDSRQGLPVNWPQVVKWRGRTVIASNGRLFESCEKNVLQTTPFQLLEHQPDWGTWGLASDGTTLLSGNRTGIYERVAEDRFVQVLDNFSADRLVMVEDDRCYVIGKESSTMIQRIDGEWKEITERVPGVGYPTVVHRAGNSVWIELGVHRVARISHRDGALHTQLFDQFPWKEPGWIHIGVVGDLVMLSSPTEGRLFFDEKSEDFIPTPEAWRFLETLPYLIGRMAEDAAGNVWVSHYQGISQLQPSGNSYQISTTGFEFVRASYPIVRVVDGSDVWFNTGTSLFHVNNAMQSQPFAVPNPQIVAVTDQSTGQVIASTGSMPDETLVLDFAQNSLSFQFFAGSYAIRNPRYDIEIEAPFLKWGMQDADSNITLPNLREGRYRMTCQLTDNRFGIGDAITFDFLIHPPWYRAPLAYTTYGLLAAAAFALLIRWLLYRSRMRNKRLSQLVKERTEALESTMHKLNLETRNAATLAERDRLAGEIHDSVQQGLAGLMIHLDGVLRSPTVSDDLRASLGTARKMLEYTRKEVQHALLNMESPLLEDCDIGKALQRIADLVSPHSSDIQIRVEGEPFAIPPSDAHHVLRICQEGMTNAVRHAKPARILLHLCYESDGLHLNIRDDGVGFDSTSYFDQSRHFGLRGMRNRAKSIGAQLDIESEPGRGTCIRMFLARPSESSSMHSTS